VRTINDQSDSESEQDRDHLVQPEDQPSTRSRSKPLQGIEAICGTIEKRILGREFAEVEGDPI